MYVAIIPRLVLLEKKIIKIQKEKRKGNKYQEKKKQKKEQESTV